MMMHVAYSQRCLLIVSCLVNFSLAAREEGSATKSESQRVEALRQKLDALQEKQERVIKKLEAEAHAARSDSSASAEVMAARQAVAEKVKRHIKSLKAEQALAAEVLADPLKGMGTQPSLEYGNFHAAAAAIKGRSATIGKAIDAMTGPLKDMEEKSQEYQRQNSNYYQKAEQFEKGTVAKLTDAMRSQLQKSLDDIDKNGWQKAYTDHDKAMAERAKQNDPAYQLVMNHEFRNEGTIAMMNMGENPYTDMSGGMIDDSGISGNLLKFMQEWLKYKKTDPLPTDPKKLERNEGADGGALRTITIPGRLPNFTETEIASATAASDNSDASGSGGDQSSLIQVLTNALELQKNSSHSSE